MRRQRERRGVLQPEKDLLRRRRQFQRLWRSHARAALTVIADSGGNNASSVIDIILVVSQTQQHPTSVVIAVYIDYDLRHKLLIARKPLG